MKNALLLLFLIPTVFCRAQQGTGKTAVFKVRAPKTECTIYSDADFFWLEKNNEIRIRIKGRPVKLFVEIMSGKIKSQDGENYTVMFTTPGQTAVSVYKSGPYGRELLASRKFEIKGPTLYFCGIALNTTSERIDMRGDNLYAYSHLFNKPLKIKSFGMYFMEDTNRMASPKLKPIEFTSDTCMLTTEMRRKVLGFQPKYNYIYFYNIICEVPDGSKRILDPINLYVERDTTAKEILKLIYGINVKE